MIIQKKKVIDIELGDIIIIDMFGIKCGKLDIKFDIKNSQFNSEENFEIFVCGIKEAPIFTYEVTEKYSTNNDFVFCCDYDSETKLPNLLIDREKLEYMFDVIINPFHTIPCYMDYLKGGNDNMTAEGFFNTRD